jgi:two-component system sensor histidine kinase UhpB
MPAKSWPRDTENTMLPRRITHQNIFRVLLVGFSLVILLLLAAAVVGIRNIHLIQENAASLVRDQGLTNRLIDELHSQQTSLTEVFSVLARDPDSVDYDGIQQQLDVADKDIQRISSEGARTAEKALWQRLQETSADFSTEARRILAQDSPQSFTSMELFRDHEAFIAVVARLIETQYRKVSAAQAQIDKRSSSLLEASLLFACAAVLLALVFAGITVRMATQLIRGMEWQTAELGRVSFHMLEDQEATARRFSHELHDELGQSLTAVKTNLSALDSSGTLQPERLADCLRLVDEAIGNVRQMSQLLRPTILDDFGLAAGLRWLSEGFAQRTGIEVTCEAPFEGRLPDETETHLFRIAQEALTNVARHASAKHVRIELIAVGDKVRLAIADDGCGLGSATTNSHGLGLIGMRARARSAGGDLDIRSRAGQGVLIEVQVPLGDETHSNSVG